MVGLGVMCFWLTGCDNGEAERQIQYKAERQSLQMQVNAGTYPTPMQVEAYNLSVPLSNPYWKLTGQLKCFSPAEMMCYQCQSETEDWKGIGFGHNFNVKEYILGDGDGYGNSVSDTISKDRKDDLQMFQDSIDSKRRFEETQRRWALEDAGM